MQDAKRSEALKELREAIGTIFAQQPERDRLLQETHISLSTLRRWLNGDSEPRLANLQLLVEKCQPEARTMLQRSIQQVWPGSAMREPTRESMTSKLQLPQASVPAEFYERVHVALAETPDSLRFWSVCQLVLKQALQHLDPDLTGLLLTVVQCVPPLESQKIRYLHESVRVGTPPWKGELETRSIFLGAESLPGAAISSFQILIEQNRGQRHTERGSIAATPILRAGRIAGCLVAESLQPRYFSSALCSLLKNYATLLAIAIDPADFYERVQIGLVLLPPAEEQKAVLNSYQQRKMAAMRTLQLDGTQAELYVLQQMGAELAAYALQKGAITD
ncbi:GAF domain-containing protein [Tengunoibacter tsumagoiensis]|nr:GAF domain-containing protein [Tengunoibacter tsumagoiensis]